MAKLKIQISFIIALSFLSQFSIAQQLDKRIYEKTFYKSLDLIYEENYDSALVILYSLDSISAPQFLKNSEEYQFYLDSQFINLEQVYVKYLIAVCHLEKSGNPQTALPYIEYVIESGYSNTPTIIYKDLGRLYHLDYQFDKAIYYFNKYLENVNQKDEFYLYVKHMNNACLNAKEIIKDTVYKEIQDLRGNINNPKLDEDQLVINNDGSILYFERDSGKNQISKIMVSYRNFDIWTKSKPLIFPSSFLLNAKSIRICGMDYNQANLLVYKETELDTKAFKCRVSADKVIEIQPTNLDFLGNNDGRICYGKNEKEVYFSSARSSGIGGYDIYRISQKINGRWNKPEILELINSTFDEVDPFYNRINSTLYFSSSSYTSMGGFDIFTAIINKKNKIGNPQNIGFAINSVGNNRSFYIPISTNTAYYSSNQPSNIRLHDLFRVKLNKSIPLTLLNGTFLAGDPAIPVKMKLTVVDIETKSKLKYSFTSNNQKGKYYIVFEPGKIYDLIFESENYRAQRITVEIPQQEYFYQIFQTISLIPIDKVNNDAVNELIVKNDFYDLGTIAQDSLKQYKNDLVNLFSNVVEKIDSFENFADENLTASTETPEQAPENNFEDLLDLIESTINNQDTATINQLFENSEKSEVYSITYNSHISEHNHFIIIGNDTIKTSPPLRAYHNIASERISKLIGSNDMIAHSYEQGSLLNAKIAFQYEMVFKLDNYQMLPKYFPVLNDIVELLDKNPYLQIVIEGISENKTADKAKELHYTKQKAQIVYEYLYNQNCRCKDILIHTSLQPSELSENYTENHYFVLIKIFDLSN